MTEQPYAILMPSNDRPAIFLSRGYAFMRFATREEARRAINTYTITDTWKDYTGGPRPEPLFTPEEPLDAYWIE